MPELPPPFFANTSEDDHCTAASVKMILQAFGRPMDFPEIDQRLEAISGIGSWMVSAALLLAEEIPGTKFYCHLNYAEVAERGQAAFEDYYRPLGLWRSDVGPEFQRVKAQASAGFQREQRHAQRLCGLCAFECHRLSRSELAQKLRASYAIAAVDWGKLIGRGSGPIHAVVLYRENEGLFHFHDPGLEPIPESTAPLDAFMQAMGTVTEVIVTPPLL